MILHLKRYGYNFELSKNSKRVDNIRIPRSINTSESEMTVSVVSVVSLMLDFRLLS